MVTVSSFGTQFECITPDLVVINCCQIEQHLCSLRSYHFGVLDERNCECFAVTSENKEAGGGEHNSLGVSVIEWAVSLSMNIVLHRFGAIASDSGQFTNWLAGIDFSQKVSNLEGGRGGKSRKIKYKERGAICPPASISPDLKCSRFVYHSSSVQVSNHHELVADSVAHVATVSDSLPLLFGKQGLS